MLFSDLVSRIIESISIAILFQSLNEEKLLQFALRVHSNYGNQMLVVSKNAVFCNFCRKTLKLNKNLQIVNIDEHVKRRKCCQERNMLGMYLIAMGAHVSTSKHKLLALEKMTLQESEEIHKP